MLNIDVFVASVQSPSYADTPQSQAANQPLSMDAILCKHSTLLFLETMYLFRV